MNKRIVWPVAALLADNMSEEDYAAFLNLVQP